MISEIKIPKLNESMENVVLVKVNVEQGQDIHQGDTIFEIETEKVCLEIEATQSGIVKAILAQEGQTLSVDTTIMILAEESEAVPDDLIRDLKQKITQSQPHFSCSGQVELNPNIIESSQNLNEKICYDNLKLGDTLPLNNRQKFTAQKMVKSKRQIPCFYLNVNADVTDLVELREELNQNRDIKLSYNDFLLKAVTDALGQFPVMTGKLVGDSIVLPDTINIGLAVAVADALFVPVIKNTEALSLADIAKRRSVLTQKAKNYELSLDDLSDACITISNLGSFGIDSFIPIVIPGQASIIGVGKILPKPMPDSQSITVKQFMSLTISADHRIANGAQAAEFLDYIKKFLENCQNFK